MHPRQAGVVHTPVLHAMVAGQIPVLHAMVAGQAPCNCMLWQVRPMFAPPATACYAGVTCIQHIACSCRLHNLHYSIDLGFPLQMLSMTTLYHHIWFCNAPYLLTPS